MTKYKKKTLRKASKSKIYKGGQKPMDYKENFDFFLDSMKELKEEKENIYSEGQLLYSQETQDKHKLLDNSVIVKFNEELIGKANVLETTITAFLETATSDYASVFLKSLSKLQNILSEANELVIFSQNIQKDFNNKNIHIHLIQTFIQLFEKLKVKINKLQETYNAIQKEVENIIKKLKENKVIKEPEPNDFEYVAQLSKEDFEVLGVKYVKGDLIFDKDTPKQFIPKNEFIKTVIDLSNNEGYYLTSNKKQRKVKISPLVPTEPLRDVQTQTYYFALLTSKDQILSGVQYVMCDKNGTVLFENDRPIPFFPKYLELKSENSNFIQEAPNKIDTITYIFIKKLEDVYPSIHVVNEAIYNTFINPQYSNLIDIFYKNKYTEIKVDDYVAPFVLPIFLLNPGDFYLIYNKSKFPIIFNISKTSKSKRIIIYPNDIVCFVYSDRSDIINYGFIVYDTNKDEITSNLVAKVNSTNNYIFMKSTLIKDKKEIVPILDSQNSLIKVPNFDLSGSLYYSPDDYFNKDPIKVNIIDPVEINSVFFSLKYTPIFTDHVCLIKFDIFVYCDENGVPVLNHYGYFQPVLTPIHYSNNQYFYYLEDKKKFVTIKEKYEYTLPLFDENYNILSQNVSPFSIKYKNVTIFSDSFGNPIIYNKLVFAHIPNTYPTELLTNIINDEFQVLEYNLEDRKNYISIYNLHNIIEIYRNQTTLIYKHYKDISGNINKLGSYLMDLQMLENQLSTTKNINIFQEIQKTFDNIKDLYNRLNSIEKIRTQQSNTINTINEIKTDKLNTLNPIEDRIKQMKEKISSLQNPDDIGYLTSTVNKLDQSISMIKDNILQTPIQTGGGNSINYLEKQDNSIKILGSSLDVLEKNLNSSIKVIQDKKREENEKVLKEKKGTLLNMDKQILDQTRTIQEFKGQDEYYMSRAPTDHEDNFNKYHLIIKTNIKTIQSIIDKVKGTQNFETPTQLTTENIDTIVSDRSANLQLIENIKKDTYKLFKEMDVIIEEASKKELDRIKRDVLKLINDFELQHKNIEILNNKLKLKHFYEINPNFIEVQQIKDLIENQQNKDILKDNYREVYNVFLREKEILNELQMKEATTIVGGSKKKSTRRTRRIIRK